MNDDEIRTPVEDAGADVKETAEAAGEALKEGAEAVTEHVEEGLETFQDVSSATEEFAQETLGEVAGQVAAGGEIGAQEGEAVLPPWEDAPEAPPVQPVMDYETWRRQNAPQPEENPTAPPYGQVPPQGPVYGGQQPGQQPPYWAPQGYYPPQTAPVYVPMPQKKRMSAGLKVFIAVACVLAALALVGFGGYVAYHAIRNQSPVEIVEEYREDFPFGELPFGDGEDLFPSRPEGGQKPFGREDGGESGAPDGQTPGRDEDGDPQEIPDFGVTPPDVDDPMPEIDVTPGKGIDITKASGKEMSPKEVYEKVVKSTVTVAVTREAGDAVQTGTGTGIVATEDGYIITNAHVVLNSKSSRVRVTTYDGQEYDAVVVGVDRSTDLAVLKTNDYDFTPAEFGDSDALSVGDTVIAIGNPGGVKFSGSMTGGYVSGLDREVGTYSENGMTYIQTDAAINPGNSGGPLVNLYGQVVGINSSKIVSSAYEGMGFAIPVSKAESILDQLMSGGYVKGRVRMGITGMDVSNTSYSMMGITDGFLITAINEDSSFAGTEAQVGDIITAIDGEAVAKLEEISNLLLKYSPGDEITVTLTRMSNSGASTLDVKITLLEDKGETQQ